MTSPIGVWHNVSWMLSVLQVLTGISGAFVCRSEKDTHLIEGLKQLPSSWHSCNCSKGSMLVIVPELHMVKWHKAVLLSHTCFIYCCKLIVFIKELLLRWLVQIHFSQIKQSGWNEVFYSSTYKLHITLICVLSFFSQSLALKKNFCLVLAFFIVRMEISWFSWEMMLCLQWTEAPRRPSWNLWKSMLSILCMRDGLAMRWAMSEMIITCGNALSKAIWGKWDCFHLTHARSVMNTPWSLPWWLGRSCCSV